MWIVELALRRPHTFIVVAIAIAIFGTLSVTRMAIDIFPSINIPVVSCIWTYTGMSAFNMENLVTSINERALTSTINGIHHIESVSLSGMSIIKVFLHQGTDLSQSVPMVTSVGTAILRQLPRGISPPFVTATSATDVPVLQLGLSSDTLSEAELFDIANNVVRSQLATAQGATIPFPYGGKYRQVMVDLDQKALSAHGLSAYEVMTAIKNQNVIDPSGTFKIGTYEYTVVLNNIPDAIAKLNDMPIKTVSTGSTDNTQSTSTIFVKDVASVHDGYQPQLNVVNKDGRRSVLFNILKSGDASTLRVVDGIKKALKRVEQIVPPECKIEILTDQSKFVIECVEEVVHEAITAAGLTALMMLALLGSWRSTLIVATSIPLAIFSAMIGLNIMGQTINSMTLGGLALAVGMLVDDATVEIENVHRNLAMGKDIVTAILDGAQQVAMPALVSTLSICIVFVPLLFLTEPSKSLFVPLGLSVVLAMMASYGLSRTVVPLMTKKLLAAESHGASSHASDSPEIPQKKAGFFKSIHLFIDGNFERAREAYKNVLSAVLDHPVLTCSLFGIFYILSFCLLPLIGEDYFPSIDAGLIRLHVNAAAGTRIEETERLFRRVEVALRKEFPGQIKTIVDNIGLPVSGINYAYSDSQTQSEADGEIMLTLDEERRTMSLEEYQKRIRRMLSKQFPECTYYFQPADIVTQILNAGLPAPIDVKILGNNTRRDINYDFALEMTRKVKAVPGTVDVCLHQMNRAPHFRWDVDRVRAREVGVTQNDISNSFLIALSSSFQTNPNFWVNPKNGIAYNLATQTPQAKLASIDDMRLISVTPSGATSKQQQHGQLLTNVAVPVRVSTPAAVSHMMTMPTYDIFAACQDRDLGSVALEVNKLVEELKKKLPGGCFTVLAGQAMSMTLAYIALLSGLAFALVLVYLLLVVNFQSWTDPLIILMAIPGAFSGIIWSLFITQTTFSIPALMGAIMTVGVASANSILMVTFANEQRQEGCDGKTAALNAGYQRFRPVIMTATAMIIGMIPMAIGSGQGGSMNAPIGRAVIGGLLVATFSTLLFVPLIFSLMRKGKGVPFRTAASASEEGR